jgi:ammonia channel protein AmtB
MPPSACVVSGSVARKSRVGRYLFFIALWVTLVYCPVARWTWYPNGWSRIRGGMDFAGGTAVHVCSGATVAAHSVFFQFEEDTWRVWRRVKFEVKDWRFWNWFSKRNREDKPSNGIWQGDGVTGTNGRPMDITQTADEHAPPSPRLPDPEDQAIDDDPYSIHYMVIGTALLWIGWFGFNGGSALGANLRAVSACLSTQVAACFGGTTGLFCGWIFAYLERKSAEKSNSTPEWTPSVQEFCEGAIAGLVAITPAAGFVSRAFL